MLCEVVLFLRGAPVGGRSRSKESSPLLQGNDTEAGGLEHTGEHTTKALSDVTIMELLLYEVVNNRWEKQIFHFKMYHFFLKLVIKIVSIYQWVPLSHFSLKFSGLFTNSLECVLFLSEKVLLLSDIQRLPM